MFSLGFSTLSAATYFLTTAGANNAQTPSNWNTGGVNGGGTTASNFTTSGDVFIIASGTSAVFAGNSNTTFSSVVTLEVNGTFQIGTGGNNAQTYLTISGTVIFNAANTSQAIIPTGGNPNTVTSFTLSPGASLITANQNGIVGATNATFSSATAGRAVVTFDTSANYEFSGATQSTLGLPATVNNLTFSGSGTKTIQAATTISGNVNIATGATFNSSTFTHLVAGGWTNNGIHTSTGTVHFNGSSAQSISASAFNNIQFSGSGTKTATGALAVTGNVAINSGTTWTAGSFTHNVGGSWTRDGTFTATGSTINFDGSTAANIGASNFNHVVFSGAGAKTATGALNIIGNLTISNNWSASSFSHTVQGDWTNNGSFTSGSSTITLNGATPQVIAGGSSTTFFNLAMNGTGLKSLGISTQVSNLITLTVGILDIGVYNLTVTSTAGGNATSYVRATGAGETPPGRLIQNVAAAQTKSFPVGDTSFNPISITNDEASGNEAFGVRVTTGTNSESNDPSKTLPRKWYIRKIQAGTSNITIAMTYNSGEGPSDLHTTSQPRFGAFNGTRWSHGNAATSNGGYTYTASGPISAIYENGFFAIGTDDAFYASKFRVSVLPSTPTAGSPNASIKVETVNNNNYPSWLLTATGFTISAFYPEDEAPYAIGSITGTVAQFTNETTITEVSFPTFTPDSIIVQATRTSGDILAVGLSAPLIVAPGAIWEPYSATTPVSLDWTTAVWRKSDDAGATWIYTTDNPNPLLLPADNIFIATDLIRIPEGISLTANMGTASVYGVIINGELIIPSGNTISHTVNNGTTIVVNGTLQNSGGTLENLTPASPIDVSGGTYLHARNGGSIPLANWQIFNSVPAKAIITGITSAPLTGLNQQFQDFTWNNSGQAVTQALDGNMTVNGTLTLTNGILSTGSNYVVQAAAGAVARTNGHINGNFRYFVPNGSDQSIAFPIGDATVYAPINITFSGNTSGSGYIDAYTTSSNGESALVPSVASGLSQSKYLQRKWVVNPTSVNFSTYSITFGFDESDKVGAPTTESLVLRHLIGNTWFTTNGSAAGNELTATGLTSFSEFFIGESDCSSTSTVWFGSINTDWNTPGNWCANAVPGASTDVLIPGGIDRYPVIGATGGLAKNVAILAGASLTLSGTAALTVSGSWNNAGSFTANSGTVTFEGNVEQTITGTTTFHNVTAANTANGGSRIRLLSNITINGVLNLSTANAADTVGLIHTENGSTSYELLMGPNATTIGDGDVTGIVTRAHTFAGNVVYTFGSSQTHITYVNVGIKPSTVSARITIGTEPVWLTERFDELALFDPPILRTAVKRSYSFSQTGGDDRVIVRMRFLASELNGNTDAEDLIFWHVIVDDEDFGAAHQHGKSAFNNAQQWIEFATIPINLLADEVLDVSAWGLAPAISSRNIWMGGHGSSVEDYSRWSEPTNWSLGRYPGQVIVIGEDTFNYFEDDVLIPSVPSGGTESERYFPVLDRSVQLATLEIQDSATLSAGIYNITVNGTTGAWSNQGTFIPGSGTVYFTHGDLIETVTISGTTDFNHLHIGANTYWQPANFTHLNLYGNLTADATAILDMVASNNTIEFKGTASRTLINPKGPASDRGFHNLYFSHTEGVITFPSTLNVAGDFINNSGASELIVTTGTTVIFDPFGSTHVQVICGTTPTPFQNLTINNPNGVLGQCDILVAGELNLLSENPVSLDKGTLHMGIVDEVEMVLKLGVAATTTGIGDVTGVVERTHTFANNVYYSFGQTYTGVTFAATPSGVNPSSISVRVTLGTTVNWTTENTYWGINPPIEQPLSRVYDIKQSDGGFSKALFSFHYKDNEIPEGVTESSLTMWRRLKVDGEFLGVERGKGSQNTTNNYITISDANFEPISDQWGDIQLTIAPSQIEVKAWNGIFSTQWNDPLNWSPSGIPTHDDAIEIPDANAVVYSPVIPAGEYDEENPAPTAKTIFIASNGVLTAADESVLTITGYVSALSVAPNASFIPGTGTVIFNAPEIDDVVVISIVGNIEFYNMTIAAGAKMRPAANSYTKIAGTLLLAPEIPADGDDPAIPMGVLAAATTVNTFEFNGSSTQLIPNPNGVTTGYRNLVFSGSGTKQLAAMLEIKADFTNNAPMDPDTNNSITYINGTTGAQTINGNTSPEFHQLVIANTSGVTIQTSAQVRTSDLLTIQESSSLTLPAGRQLHAATISNLAGTAGLVIGAAAGQPNASFSFGASGLISEEVPATVQLYTKGSLTPEDDQGEEIVPAYYNWQYVGIPVTGVQKGNPMLTGSFMAQFNEVRRDYDPVPAVLEPFRGYALTQQQPRTFGFAGNLVKGTGSGGSQSIPLSFTGAEEDADRGFNLVANSFTTAVAIGDMNFTNAEPTIYLMNTGRNIDGAEGTGDGQYIAVPKLNAGQGGLPSEISSLQGFYVQATGASATVVLPYSDVTVNSEPMRVGTPVDSSEGDIVTNKIPAEVNADNPYTIVEVIGAGYTDRLWLFTQPGTSKGYDAGWDGRKLDGIPAAPQLYAVGGGERWQVSTSANVNQTVLGFRKGVGSEFVMRFRHHATASVYPHLYLVDMHAQLVIPVGSDGATYHFTEERTMATERFMIVTSMDDVMTAPVQQKSDLRIYRSVDGLLLENPDLLPGSLHLYDTTGRLLFNQPMGASFRQIISQQLPSGTYIVQMWLSHGEHIVKKVLW